MKEILLPAFIFLPFLSSRNAEVFWKEWIHLQRNYSLGKTWGFLNGTVFPFLFSKHQIFPIQSEMEGNTRSALTHHESFFWQKILHQKGSDFSCLGHFSPRLAHQSSMFYQVQNLVWTLQIFDKCETCTKIPVMWHAGNVWVSLRWKCPGQWLAGISHQNDSFNANTS